MPPSSLSTGGPGRLPEAPVQRWIAPFTRFFHIEAAGGFVLVVYAIVALAIANSKWAEPFAAVWEIELSLAVGDWQLSHTLGHWITDGLMTIFFFVVGLEIKRELVAGELRDRKKAALPAMAALGGMLVPALIFLALEGGGEGRAGWGIPIATDIAFVVAIIALFGRRIPAGLKVFVLSLAIADDIGAVLVIALFYTSQLSWVALAFAAAGFGVVYLFNRIGVRRVPVYVATGIGIWLAFVESGVHPTVAGVMLGLLTPASAWIGDQRFLDIARQALDRLHHQYALHAHHEPYTNGAARERQQVIGELATTAHESISPLERLQWGLHPWVAFLVVPLFALANAGVTIDLEDVTHPLVYAVAGGLFIGKPLGIFAFSYVAVKLGIARLPAGVNWPIMLAAGWLAGVGFTMSLLIGGLALGGAMLEAGKVGTLLGSLASAVVGTALLAALVLRKAPTTGYDAEDAEEHAPAAARAPALPATGLRPAPAQVATAVAPEPVRIT